MYILDYRVLIILYNNMYIPDSIETTLEDNEQRLNPWYMKILS